MHIVEISGILEMLHIPGSKAANFNYQINYKIISKYLILGMLQILGSRLAATLQNNFREEFQEYKYSVRKLTNIKKIILKMFQILYF